MSEEKTYCYHCGDDCGVEPVPFDNKSFCCNGCKSVYEILNTNTLNQYYRLEQAPGVKPGKQNSEKYKFLQNEEIADRLYAFKEAEIRRVVLFLPEIHCASCIWLLENLHLLNDGVITAEVNFIKKEAAISFNVDRISFQELATLLDKIGYPPKFDQQRGEKKSKITRKFYLQLGVAFFCFGNIMLFSFPEYTNIDASYFEFRSFFAYLIFAVSIPMLLFSARDYWISAFKAIRSKTVNLDVPITIGILALYGRSCYDIFTENGPGYMDSFAGFVLFLLIGKWFQNKTYQALSFERDYKSYFPLSVTKIVGNEEQIIPIENVGVKDRVLIKNEELIPADAKLISSKANIDYSFVTGESRVISKTEGDELFAGGKQMGDAIVVEVTKKVEQSYLTQLWNQKAFKKEISKGLSELTDKLSRYFIIGVLIVALVTAGIWYFVDSSNVVNIVTAVLIVACPCALALSIPFTFGSAMRAAGRNRLYLKNTDAVEQLGRVTDIVFDKTGTITNSDQSKIAFVGDPLEAQTIEAVASITRNSSHPLSKVLYAQLKNEGSLNQVEQFEEILGHGIKGVVEGKTYHIGSAKWVEFDREATPETRVYIKEDDKLLGYYRFENHYRKEFLDVVTELKEQFRLHVLSGDNESERENLNQLLSNSSRLLFNQQPIDKLKYIEQLQQSGKVVLMMGDGLNDAGALKQANIGIVVSDDVYNFSPACDGIIDARGLNKLPVFIRLGQFSIKILRASYVFSLLYNTVGLAFAVYGALTPLVAAILMPLSSISVVALASFSIGYFETKNIKK